MHKAKGLWGKNAGRRKEGSSVNAGFIMVSLKWGRRKCPKGEDLRVVFRFELAKAFEGGGGFRPKKTHRPSPFLSSLPQIFSLGNTLTLQSECPTTLDKRAFRYLVVTSHYRQEMTFTSDALKASKRAVERVDKCMRDIKDIQKTGENKDTGELGELCDREVGKFYKAVADDLSTPRCAASMFAVVKGAEKEIKRGRREGGGWDIDGLGRAMDTLRMFDEVFGILYGQEEREGDGGGGEVPEDVMELVKRRGDAKAGKDWGLADELRDEIAARGWQVKDSKNGATVVKL